MNEALALLKNTAETTGETLAVVVDPVLGGAVASIRVVGYADVWSVGR